MDLKKIESLFPIQYNYDLITFTDNVDFKSVLDIGFGGGGASLYFAFKEKEVTSLGLNIDTYDYPREYFKKCGIKTFDMEFLSFNSDKKYDAIWMSHVLEHTLNVGLFLDKANSMLNDDGWLFVMVPPYEDLVCGGHLTTGWNIGHLMYTLLLSGFNIKDGHYIKIGYNICAFVQKSKTSLPELRMDYGDLNTTSDLWPLSIVNQGKDRGEYIVGNVEYINWFGTEPSEIICKKQISVIKNRLLESKFKEKLISFIKDYKEQKICFYGAGLLARILTEDYDLSRLNVSGFLDNNPEKAGSKLGGYAVFLPSKIEELKPDILIISVENADKILPFIKDLKQKFNLKFKIYDLNFNKI